MISKIAVLLSVAYIAATSADPASSHLPDVIDETKHQVQHCPEGFIPIGKECAKTITETPEITCPPKSYLIEGKCVAYIGKETQCPIGFTDSHGLCVKTIKASPEIVCPKTYVLRSKEYCVTTVALPGKAICPAGTIPKGDKCAMYKTELPDYVCPKEYKLKGHSCVFEETYDCTPQRKFKELSVKSEKEVTPTPVPGKEEVAYELQIPKPVVEEYIIAKTCKRITTEPARPICAKGIFDGKMCQIDVLIAPINRPGGFEEKVIRASAVCPEEFNYNEETKECYKEKEVLPEVYCPSGTVELENKCGLYSVPKLVCPEHFHLFGKTCSKTIYTKPHVEVTITYSCHGKDCKNKEEKHE